MAQRRNSSSSTSTLTYRTTQETSKATGGPTKASSGRRLSEAVSDSRSSRLLAFSEIPSWYSDNHYIQTGYRPITPSTCLCFKSWLSLHNETLNIFTHLLPALFFLIFQAFLILVFRTSFPQSSINDFSILMLWLISATTTLLLSSTYHTLTCHSQKVEALTLRADFTGIVLQTWSSFIGGIYFGFPCPPNVQFRYLHWAFISFFTVTNMVIVFHPGLTGFRYRWLRTAAFTGTGISGLAPLGHGIVLLGWNHMWDATGMP